METGSGGARPTGQSTVVTHYHGTLVDGTVVDSSVERGEPAEFGVNQVIPAWTEALQLMVAGEKSRFWIPEALAYKGVAGAPQGTLVFDVELISFR